MNNLSEFEKLYSKANELQSELNVLMLFHEFNTDYYNQNIIENIEIYNMCINYINKLDYKSLKKNLFYMEPFLKKATELYPLMKKLMSSKLYIKYNVESKYRMFIKNDLLFNLNFNFQLVDDIFNKYYPNNKLTNDYDIKIMKLKLKYNEINTLLINTLGKYKSVGELKNSLVNYYKQSIKI